MYPPGMIDPRLRLAQLLILAVALVPASAAGQSPSFRASGTPIALEPVADDAYGLRSVAPVGWTDVGMGIRMRDRSGADPTLLALQSAPVAPDALWPSLLPQLGLTERPEPASQRTTAAGLVWDLYAVPMGPTTADLGLAATPGRTYLVLLVSTPTEQATLVDTVFLPAVEALEPLVVQRTPLPSGIGYTERDVTFAGGAADVTLAGTLSVPERQGPHPAIVLMTGSGPEDRDESLPGMTLRPFALVADALARAGVAVLRYDDRGTAASTGDYAAATLTDFTADGQAAFDWLRRQPAIDPGRVGLLGHSEGGAYIASIAARDPAVAFVVGLAPMVRSGMELMLEQTRAIARSQGSSEEEAEAAVRANRRLYQAALSPDQDQLEAILRDDLGARYDALDAAARAQFGDRATWIDQQVAAQLPTLQSPWFRSLLRADPLADWRRVDAPVLGLFGGKDVQVVAGPESEALEAALGDRDGRSRVEVLADANHLFQAAVTGSLAEYPTLEQVFMPQLLPLVTDWVGEVVGPAR